MVIPSLALEAPTATYAFIDSDSLPGKTHFFGLGGTLAGELKFALSPRLHLAFRWDSRIYAPLKTSEITAADGARESVWHHGAASVLLNFRIMKRVGKG